MGYPILMTKAFEKLVFGSSDLSIEAVIALGSNLGDSARILTNAITVIDTAPGIQVLARSHLYKTAPVGPPQPDYINACITVETSLSPRDLLHQLLTIESQLGRVRKKRWGARSLDLDLLFYGDRIIEATKLTVPHPRLHERPFVLVPLLDVAPHWHHPVLIKTVEQIYSELSEQGLMTGVERLVNYELHNSLGTTRHDHWARAARTD